MYDEPGILEKKIRCRILSFKYVLKVGTVGGLLQIPFWQIEKGFRIHALSPFLKESITISTQFIAKLVPEYKRKCYYLT